MDPFFSLLIFCTLPWLIAGWLRIPRYARYFQQEGYEYKRYSLWLQRTQSEKRYSSFCLIAGPVVLIASCAFILRLPADERGLAFVSHLVLAGLAFYFAPRDRVIKQKFAVTQRALRLLITAFIVEAIPLILGVIIMLTINANLTPGPNNPPDEAFFILGGVEVLIALGLSMILGLAGYLITSFAVPLANVINWPIEEAFRQYFLSKARSYLKRSGATVIAITGSYGKTSTKHYLHHILEGRFRVLMTPKSYNTLLGISRVINDVLAKDVSYEYFIVETDAYFVGENARICKLVNPQMGMIMTVGPMHLERLGSMEAIEKAQYEVIEALPPDGAGFFNGDDPAVRSMAGRGYPQTAIMVTKAGVPGAKVEALNVHMSAEGLAFDVRDNRTGETRSMRAPLYGDHNVTNILMAAAVAQHLGMSLAEIAMRVTTLEPAEHRLIRRVMPDRTILIDDTYSANPVGTQTALGVLALHHDSPHKVVVSSGMFELGAVSEQENRKLGIGIAAVATDVILIGATQTRPVKDGLDIANFPAEHLHVVDTLNEAVSIYRSILCPGDALLMLTDLPDTYA